MAMDEPIPDPEVDALDPDAAHEAFEAVRPRLEALGGDALARVSTDVQQAAIVAAFVARQVSTPQRRARFAELPASCFDPSTLDDLEPVALACWYAAVQLLRAKAQSTDVKLPATLVHDATSTRGRMLQLLDYHFGDDPVDGPEIASIKRGSGHADLANDLMRLAELWLAHREQLEGDRKHYEATDGDDARRYAQAIFALLGGHSEDQRRFSDLVARAWTLLTQVYGEVADTGRWLFRHDDAAPSFPSLYTAGRKRRRRPKKDEAAEDPAPPQ